MPGDSLYEAGRPTQARRVGGGGGVSGKHSHPGWGGGGERVISVKIKVEYLTVCTP